MADHVRIGNLEIKVYMDYASPSFEPTDFFPNIPSLIAWSRRASLCVLDTYW